jgi:teichuronic acid biosynthesis glycosyltransferase TuaC
MRGGPKLLPSVGRLAFRHVRILVVPSDFPYPGNAEAGIFVLRQCQALVERGHEIRVMCVVPIAPPLGAKWKAYRSIPSHYVYENIPVRVIRAIIPPRMLGLHVVRLQVQRALRSVIAEFQPAVVHVHCLIPTGFLAAGINRPVVLTAHGSDAYAYPLQRGDLRRAAATAVRGAACVVAVSAFVKKEVERLGRSGVRVIYNGADPQIFAPGDRQTARRGLNVSAGAPVIVCGGPAKSKGLLDLCTAAQQLSHLHPLIIVPGTGPESEDIKAAYNAAGVASLFTGNVSQPELAQIFAAADIVALPSYGEGLPALICEAMMAGRAVVATDVGGMPEIVKDNETGLIIPVGDVSALANAITAIITDNGLRTRFESNAHQFAAERLTWGANAQAYEDVYKEALRF